jgi:uncharacterized membrane protein
VSSETKASLGIAEPGKPSVGIYWIVAVLALVGLADATFLTVAHLTGDDAVCGSLAGCSTVLGSSYSAIRGIPTAGFGAIAYFSAFSLAVLAAFRYANARGLLLLLVGLMLLASFYFLYLQAFVLHAFCPFCLGSAAITFILAGLMLFAPRP